MGGLDWKRPGKTQHRLHACGIMEKPEEDKVTSPNPILKKTA
jgi:hypothetical protein